MIKTGVYGLKILWSRLATLFQSGWFVLRIIVAGGKIGPHCRVRGWVNLNIHPGSVVQIAEGLRIKSGFTENPAGGYRRAGVWVSKGATLKIGKNTGLSNCTIMCAQEVAIGDNVFIGGGSNIYDTDFHSIRSIDRLKRPDTAVGIAPINIGDNVFIGAHSIILKGITIGHEAVIGAGSVVTKNVPPGEIWAGNPAKFIRRVE